MFNIQMHDFLCLVLTFFSFASLIALLSLTNYTKYFVTGTNNSTHTIPMVVYAMVYLLVAKLSLRISF